MSHVPIDVQGQFRSCAVSQNYMDPSVRDAYPVGCHNLFVFILVHRKSETKMFWLCTNVVFCLQVPRCCPALASQAAGHSECPQQAENLLDNSSLQRRNCKREMFLRPKLSWLAVYAETSSISALRSHQASPVGRIQDIDPHGQGPSSCSTAGMGSQEPGCRNRLTSPPDPQSPSYFCLLSQHSQPEKHKCLCFLQFCWLNQAAGKFSSVQTLKEHFHPGHPN